MYIENQISELFLDFAEIFDKININGYSRSQKDEMSELFEVQTVEKCLDFICSSIHFAEDITALNDLVLTVIQKEKIDFGTKEGFLKIFDKAASLYDDANRVNNEPLEGGDIQYIIDEIKEIKKKNNNLKSENDVLKQEIEEKSASLTEIETLFIKLKYDYYKLNDQWETMNEDQVFLRNKMSAAYLQKDLDKERREEVELNFVEQLEDLRSCVAERNSQINKLEDEKEELTESLEIIKVEVQIKNRFLEDMKNEIEDLKTANSSTTNVKEFDDPEESASDLDLWKNVVPEENLRTHIEKDHGRNIVHRLLDEKNLSEKCAADFSYALESNVAEFKGDEIEHCSTRKSLSEELLGAWNVLALSDSNDALLIEHDDPVIDFFVSQSEDIKQTNLLTFFEDSGFHQTSFNGTEYFSYTEEEEIFKEEKFIRPDIQTKFKEIREQLSVLENNLRERKRKVNKSLSSTLVSIICSCFELFY
eukprot:GFUD01028556.1.p1 GENE.GFUD01028556.1~~GFUD01028556.1.p1  ORF type:complete len:485 (+),score=122.97 GFUD01028556.1:26-1456(+)